MILCLFQQLRLWCRHQLDLVYTKQRNSLKDSVDPVDPCRGIQSGSGLEAGSWLTSPALVPLQTSPLCLAIPRSFLAHISVHVEHTSSLKEEDSSFPVLSVFRVEFLTDWSCQKLFKTTSMRLEVEERQGPPEHCSHLARVEVGKIAKA